MVKDGKEGMIASSQIRGRQLANSMFLHRPNQDLGVCVIFTRELDLISKVLPIPVPLCPAIMLLPAEKVAISAPPR